MMRKIIPLFLLLLFCCGCSSASSPENTPVQSEEEYRKELLQKIAAYDETRLQEYLAYYDLGPHFVVPLVNQGILNDDNCVRILELSHDPYFLLSRVERYLANPKETVRQTVEAVNADRDKVPYEEAEETDVTLGLYVEANKYYYFPDGYEPEDLCPIEAKYGIESFLREPAYQAYVQMAEDAKKEGLDFYITSAYRSYNKQKSLYSNYAASDGVEAADRYSARPGFSDHQTGLTVDILTSTTNFATFEDSAEARWLAENAWRYGFILRYPQDKEDVTGYTYEAWHFRYVGDIAEAVYESGLTYDEYYTYFFRGE